MFSEGHALDCGFQYVTTFEVWLEVDMTKKLMNELICGFAICSFP